MRIAICSSHDTFVVISRKLRHVADCRFVADTTSLLSTLETGAFAAVIISACASGDAGVLHIMKRWRADLPVVGWISESRTGDSFVLSNISVSKLVFENDPSAVQRIAEEAVSTTIVRAMGLAMLPLLETGNIDAAVAAGRILLDARTARNVSELAAWLQISRRTLYNRFRALDLPSPEPMLVWCGLLAICAMIRDGGTSINFAARANGVQLPGRRTKRSEKVPRLAAEQRNTACCYEHRSERIHQFSEYRWNVASSRKSHAHHDRSSARPLRSSMGPSSYNASTAALMARARMLEP